MMVECEKCDGCGFTMYPIEPDGEPEQDPCGTCDTTGKIWIPTGWLAEFLDPEALPEMVGS